MKKTLHIVVLVPPPPYEGEEAPPEAPPEAPTAVVLSSLRIRD